MRRRIVTKRSGIGILLAAAVLSAFTASAATWYVDLDNTGTEDGTSWATAFNTIQPAIDAAFLDGGGEVWVAEGVYDEARVSGDPNTGSIVMKDSVNLYGGFIGIGAGGGETLRTQRDWVAHVVTLDGSTSREGSPAYHVVVGAANSVLDGCTVRGGHGSDAGGIDGQGGGVYSAAVDLEISNCIIEGNQAGSQSSGGGIYGNGLRLTNCVVRNNLAGQQGGAAYLSGPSLTISGCTFFNNEALTSGGAIECSGTVTITDTSFIENTCAGWAGAMNLWGIQGGMIDGCLFRGNRAEGATSQNGGGGAVYVYTNAGVILTVSNCIFSQNWSGLTGSALAITTDPNGQTRLVNCTITDNLPGVPGAGFSGGAITCYYTQSGPQITNCVLWNSGAEIVTTDASFPIVEYSTIRGGFPGTGNLILDPLFVDAPNGDLHLRADSPCLDSGKDASSDGVTTDIEGIARGLDGLPSGAPPTGDGSKYDMGAFEARVPTEPEVAIAPSSPQTADPLVCTVVTPSTGGAGLANQYHYVWTSSEGIVLTRGPKPDTSDTLDAQYTVKHETWTCSVRFWDGLIYSLPASDAVTILNTPPGPLTLTIPSIQSANVNLRCEMDKSPDPDGDVSYAVAWFVKRDGETVFSPWGGAVITADTFTQIDAAHTEPGDAWYVEVTYGDGETADTTETSSVSTIVAGGIEPSFISLSVVPTTITLGQFLTATGQIFPTPVSGATVNFESTAPGGSTLLGVPDGVVIPVNSYTKLFYPTEASEGRPAWSVRAFWSGDATYRPASSGTVSFTVHKAQPTLSAVLSASSAAVGFADLEATVEMAAPLPGTLAGLLEDQPVALFLKKPDASSAGPVMSTTDAEGVATFLPADFALAGIEFTEPGTWQFIAEYAGGINFKTATSVDYDQPETPRLTIKDGGGYALLVLGKLDAAGEGLAEHRKTLDSVYRSFRTRGFAHEDIYYLREGASPPVDIVVDDATPSKGEVQTLIEDEIAVRMAESPAPFYLVMIDHGGVGNFFVYSGAFGAARTITPTELNGYLDTLQSTLDVLNPAAADEDIVLVYGACHSGSFIPAVSAPGRTIITSSAADQISHRGPFDPVDGQRDGEIFVTQLFRNLAAGADLKASFEQASSRIVEFTTSRSNPASAGAERPQEPRLDDNGDGDGTTGDLLSFTEGQDGAVAFGLTLGFGVNAGDSVGWVTSRQTVALGPAESVGTLWARSTQQPSLGHTAWLEVKTPAYLGADPSATGTGAGGDNYEDFQQQLDIANLSSDNTDPADGTYNWSSFGTLFNAPGTYQVYYFIKDGGTGETSSHLLTTVFRSSLTNTAPPPVDLLFPADGAARPLNVFLAWTESVDPDGDGVTYRAEVATALDFTGDLIARDNIGQTFTEFGPADGILDGQTYYWRVIAVDEYGAELTPDESRSFTVDQNNPDTDGYLTVTVIDSVTDAPLAGAAVALKKGTATVTSDTSDLHGTVVFQAAKDSGYSVTASRGGYVPGTAADIGIGTNPGTLEIELDSTSQPFRWGDVNADGVAGMLDAVAIVKYYDNEVANSFIHPRGIEAAELDGKPLANPSINVADAIEIVKKRIRLIAHFAVDTLEPFDFGPEGGKAFGGHEGLMIEDSRVKLADTSALIAAPRTLSVARAVGGEAGEALEFPVTIDDAAGIEGAVISVLYDAAALEFIEAAPGNVSGAWELFVFNGSEPGEAIAAGAGTSTPGGPGSLAVFRFRALGVAGSRHHNGGGPGGVTLGEETELNDGEVGFVVTK